MLGVMLSVINLVLQTVLIILWTGCLREKQKRIDELTERLCRGLQGDEYRQKNARPGDPTYTFVHADSFFPCKWGV